MLDSLETQADAANRDIKIAIAHVDEATAATNIAHSYLLPTVGAAPKCLATARRKTARTTATPRATAATYNDIQLPLLASYEIDAWGRVRRSVQSARATQEATEADLRFVRLSVEATVAIDYYQSARDRSGTADRRRDARRFHPRPSPLTTDRFHHGLNGELEVEQAQTLLDQTITQKQALQIQRAQLEHAIAVLLGRTVEGFSLPDQPSQPEPRRTFQSDCHRICWREDLISPKPTETSRPRPRRSALPRPHIFRSCPSPACGIREHQCREPAELAEHHCLAWSFGCGANFHRRQIEGRCRPGTGGVSAVPRAVREDCPGRLSGSRGSTGCVALPGGRIAIRSECGVGCQASGTDRHAALQSRAWLDTSMLSLRRRPNLPNEQTAAQISGQRLVASVVLIKALGGGWAGGNTP